MQNCLGNLKCITDVNNKPEQTDEVPEEKYLKVRILTQFLRDLKKEMKYISSCTNNFFSVPRFDLKENYVADTGLYKKRQ